MYPTSQRRSAITRRLGRAMDEMLHESYQGVADAFREFGETLINNTPVRTGFARSHWRFSAIGNTSPANKDPKHGDKKLSPPEGRLKQVAENIRRKLKEGKDVDAAIFNDTRYFVYIEYGGKATPAYGVVRRAVANLPSILAKHLRG